MSIIISDIFSLTHCRVLPVTRLIWIGITHVNIFTVHLIWLLSWFVYCKIQWGQDLLLRAPDVTPDSMGFMLLISLLAKVKFFSVKFYFQPIYTDEVLVEDQFRHFLLVFEGLFLYQSVHPFKCPVFLNVTLGLIFNGNIFNFSMHMHIRDSLQSCWFFAHNREGIVPIIAILVDMVIKQNLIVSSLFSDHLYTDLLFFLSNEANLQRSPLCKNENN